MQRNVVKIEKKFSACGRHTFLAKRGGYRGGDWGGDWGGAGGEAGEAELREALDAAGLRSGADVSAGSASVSASSGARAGGDAPEVVGGFGRVSARVPVINKVAAGYPTEFTDLGYPARVADEYVAVPGVHDADAFAARVCGESMLPEYREGDVVVFSPMLDAVHGSDCFVRFSDDAGTHDGGGEFGSGGGQAGETTFKRVFFEAY